MKQRIWSLIAVAALVIALAIPIGGSWLITDSSATGTIWAAPPPPPGPGGPPPPSPGPGGPGGPPPGPGGPGPKPHPTLMPIPGPGGPGGPPPGPGGPGPKPHPTLMPIPGPGGPGGPPPPPKPKPTLKPMPGPGGPGGPIGPPPPPKPKPTLKPIPGPGGPPHYPGPGGPPPPPQHHPSLSGGVLVAKGGFVVINIGSHNGVHPGMIFVVRHKIATHTGIIHQRRARIKVDHIDSHTTRCIVIQWLYPKQKIYHNDTVTEEHW